MKVVVDINHPAHVHYFKHFVREMRGKGHEVLITASEKDIIFRLLQKYDLDFTNVGNYGGSMAKKMVNIPLLDLRYYRSVKAFKPDILVGFGSIRAAHVSFLLRRPCVNFEDTEHSTEQIRLYKPFVKAILTPTCYAQDLGEKQIRFDGYMELASLHPNRFTPDPAILGEIGVSENEPFIIVRFVSWQASHDVGQHGIQDKVGFIKSLERYGRVLITSEGALPPELRAYQVQVSPEKMHDLLFYTHLYLGEGGTMATEAALLGTPSIYLSTLAGTMGNFIELEETYDLLYSFKDSAAALTKANSIMTDPSSKKSWKRKRERFLGDKIDVTAFMVWLIDNYPQSLTEMKERPEIERSFAFSHGGEQ